MADNKPSSKDIYDQLREMILNFELQPGSRITESELAGRFGVSRTPVRGALQRLETENYITILPKQGCFVRNLDIEYLSQIYQVRVALEVFSLERACTYMPDASLKELAAAWDPERHEGRSNNPEAMEARDESFHIALAQGGGNAALVHYLNDINGHIRIIRRLDFTDSGRIDHTYNEHHKICRHLLRRDLKKAQAVMRAHIARSENFAKTLTLTQLARRKSQHRPRRPG